MTNQQQYAMPPVNVRVQHANGSTTAVETVYTGTRDGLHHWHSIRDVKVVDGDKTLWDEMPADTRVHLYQLKRGGA